MVNITSITNAETSEQVITQAHNLTAFPALIQNLSITMLVTLIVGLIFFDSSRGRMKFFWVWLISFILTGIVTLFLMYNPFVVQSINEFFIKLFN